MKNLNITFTDSEITELKGFYQLELEKVQLELEKVQLELEKVQKRYDNIKSILEKVESTEAVETVEAAEADEATETVEAIKTVETVEAVETVKALETSDSLKAEPKKRKKKERKSKWSNLILETLLNKNTLYPTSDITNLIIQKYQFPQSEFKKVKKAIGESLSRMKTIKAYRTGDVGVNYYGLARWFDKSGELKEKYKDKLTPTLTEKAIKSKWGKIILDLLRQHDKPIKFNDLVEEAINKFDIPKDKYKNVRQAITNSSFQLRNRHKKIRNFKVNGERGKYVGLSRWFDKNGELKEKYKDESTPTLTEKDITQKEIDKKTTAKKPRWVSFVLNTIKENDTLLQAKTLADIAMEKLEIDKNDSKKTRKSISYCLREQTRVTKKLKLYPVVGRFPYYGFTKWFDKNGELEAKYKEKLTPTLTEKDNTPKKPKWVPFILNTIKRKDTLVQTNTLINIAMEEYNINKNDFDKTRWHALSALSDLESNERKRIKSYLKAGVVGKYFGLPEWFDKNGELIEKYKEKIASPETVKTIRLSNIARELNIGISTILDFLVKKGYKVDPSPNTKISNEIHQVLLKEFMPEKIVKKDLQKEITEPEEKPESEEKAEEKPKKEAESEIWVPFVLNTIKGINKLLQAKILTKFAMSKFKINESDYEKTRLQVANALSNLENGSKKLKTYSKDGVKGRYYGLSEWFETHEELSKHL